MDFSCPGKGIVLLSSSFFKHQCAAGGNGTWPNYQTKTFLVRVASGTQFSQAAPLPALPPLDFREDNYSLRQMGL